MIDNKDLDKIKQEKEAYNKATDAFFLELEDLFILIVEINALY